MKVENLDTAARFAKKRRTLKELGDLLQNHVHHAEVLVVVTIGEKKRQASIQEETFNALMCKLIEDEIKNIDDFVEKL